MKKQIVKLLISAMVIGVLCGCGSDPQETLADDAVTLEEDQTTEDITEEPVEESMEEVTEESTEEAEEDEPEEADVIDTSQPIEIGYMDSFVEFTEYYNNSGITETAIAEIDENGCYILFFNDSTREIESIPYYVVISTNKVISGSVTGETGNLPGEFVCNDFGLFCFILHEHYDGILYISVEYEDGTTEDLTLHLVDPQA